MATSRPASAGLMGVLQQADGSFARVGRGTACGLLALLFLAWVLWPAFFSPLAKIPGPQLARFTKWWLRNAEWQGQRTERIHQLHQQYGPAVRLSPYEVSFNHPVALKEIYAATLRLDRPSRVCAFDNYDTLNVFTTNEHTLHGPRGNLYSVAETLIKEIRRAGAETVDGAVEIKSMLHYIACDVMSRFVFGPARHLDLVGDAAQRPLVQDRISANHFRKLLLHGWHPSLMRAISKSAMLPTAITSLASRNSQILQVGMSVAKEAQQAAACGEKPGTSVVDKLAARMLDPENKARLSTAYIAIEAMDHMLAGSLTMALTLTALFHHMYLPRNRYWQEALWKELNSTFEDLEGLEADAANGYKKLDACPHVLAVVKETLRLNPSIPDSLERVNTSIGNLSIMGYQIPKGTVISSQPFSVHRDATVFTKAEEWVPERWIAKSTDDDEGLRARNRQFWAFGSGSRMCLGMQFVLPSLNLAWMEMKVVVAAIYLTYETQLGSSRNGADAETRLFPRGTDCPVVFKERQRL